MKLLGWQIFIGIWGGTAIIAGIIPYTYYSFEKVLGCNKDRKDYFGHSAIGGGEDGLVLGILSKTILGVGNISIFSWIVWLIAYFCKVNESSVGVYFIYVITVSVICNISICAFVAHEFEDRLPFVMLYIFGCTILGGIVIGIITKSKLYGGIGSLVSGAVGIVCGFIHVLFACIIILFVYRTRVIELLLIFLNYKEIICNNCHRYSVPLKSNYTHGIRRCEHCDNTLERTKDMGKVIFTFGNYQVERGNRVFILKNPDFEKKTAPIDVSEVYIDTGSCKKQRLERFITYIVNYPPKNGLKSVQIFIRGSIDDLGHLKNSILNNFKKVSQI